WSFMYYVTWCWKPAGPGNLLFCVVGSCCGGYNLRPAARLVQDPIEIVSRDLAPGLALRLVSVTRLEQDGIIAHLQNPLEGLLRHSLGQEIVEQVCRHLAVIQGAMGELH